MIGKSLGHYKIIEPLGAGGMGEVYRAHDTNLKRDVAIKVLPEDLAADQERLARLEREAHLLASLNHPGIATIHGLEESDGTRFLVLELVEGDTLAERLAGGRLEVEKALEIARQIAEALEAAHEKGVIHRDLKPSNVKVTPDGRVKVLDFGLAKAFEVEADAEGDLTRSPTITVEGTRTGVIMGTAAYMSPEQTRGKPVDKRTDIFAFGAVLYEMLAGKRAFGGETVSDTLAAILKEEPDWNALPSTTPRAVRRALRRCLQKDPRQRLHDIADARIEVAEAFGEEARAGNGEERYRAASWKSRATAGVVTGLGATGLIAAVWVAWSFLGSAEPIDELYAPHFEIGEITRLTSVPGNETQPSLSPDGAWLAFTSDAAGNKDIWIKNIATVGEPILLSDDPADDSDPDWSPDGSTIAFRSNRAGGGIYVIPAFGGDATPITDFGYRPRWSPDGSRILFQLRRGSYIPNEVYIVNYPVHEAPNKMLPYQPGGDPFYRAEWSPDGARLLYDTGNYVAGSGLAIRSTDTAGEERFLRTTEDSKVRGAQGWAWVPDGSGLVLSEGGALVYRSIDVARALVSAQRVSLTTGNPTRPDRYPDISLDGSRVAFNSSTRQADIWKVQLDPDTGLPIDDPLRITDSPTTNERYPEVLPGDSHFLFVSDRDGRPYIYVADLEGNDVWLVDGTQSWFRMAVSPDGRWIAALSNGRTHLIPFDPETLSRAGPPRSVEDAWLPNNWGAEGLSIQPTERESSAIWLLEDPGASPPTLRSYSMAPDFYEKYPYRAYSTVSPDGEWLAFSAYRERHEPSVFIVRRGETEPTLVWYGSGFPDWLADPERIHLFSERPDETQDRLGFVRFDPEAGEPIGDFQLLDLVPGRGELGGLANVSMTRDRQWLLFTFEEVEGDLFVAEIAQGRR